MSKEYRLRNLASLRDQLELDAILVTTPANLYYFSGFRTTLYTRFNGLLSMGSGSEILVTSYVDEQLAKAQVWGPVWVRNIRIHGPIARSDVFQEHLDTLRRELHDARRLGVDGISFTLYNELKAAFPHLEVVEISAALNELRRVKDAAEITAMRKANEIALACLGMAASILARQGVTEADLGAELEFQARRLGADGYGYPILISGGEKIAAPHSPPSSQPIPPDVPFVRIAFSPTYDGYCSSLIRTYCRGPAPDGTRGLERAFFEAMREIEGMLRPGATVQDILRTVGDCYERLGVRSFWGGDMGYSLGVTVHEPPRIGGTDNTAMAAGMVLAIMPGLRKPGAAIFHHSDVYHVTDSGCECLSPGLQKLIEY